MLFEGMRERYATIKSKLVPDGLGGSIDLGRIEDIEFDAVIGTDLSTEAMIGDAVVKRSNYTFAVPLEIPLFLGQFFQRLSDGQFFRVTSTPRDKEPPSYSLFSDYQITAEATKSAE